jgi:hypothetical protein
VKRMVQGLAANGASVHAVDGCGQSPLHVAAGDDNLDAVEVFGIFLVYWGRWGQRWSQPPHLRHLSCFCLHQLLLQLGAHVEVRDQAGWTPTMVAGANLCWRVVVKVWKRLPALRPATLGCLLWLGGMLWEP